MIVDRRIIKHGFRTFDAVIFDFDNVGLNSLTPLFEFISVEVATLMSITSLVNFASSIITRTLSTCYIAINRALPVRTVLIPAFDSDGLNVDDMMSWTFIK